MVNIEEKVRCSGCAACANVCPKKCIKMEMDNEGFLYPVVNTEECIECGLCDKICPILHKQKNEREIKEIAYAVYNTKNDIRKNSTSGGFFTAISEKIIDLGGIVFGVVFDDNFKVKHTAIDKKEELYRFRGSKYVQSEINDTYIKIKRELENDRYVLFSGTPCQVYGLKAFLQKDYEKLYTIDLICHGVPSPGLWEKYIKNKQDKGKISKLYFREKTYGFNSSTMSIYYENGKKYKKGHETDEMLRLFFGGISLRPSCHECNFKGRDRISDFTIGDCFKVGELIEGEDSDIGTTLLVVHSKKAESLLPKIENIKYQEVNFDKALLLNGGDIETMYLASAEPSKKRSEFFDDFNKLEYKDLIAKYCPKTTKTRIKSALKPILYKLGILDKVKNKMK